eukprot:SAG22_NODE_45_length_24718_cov_12.462448_4_plen_644_part_00
MAGAARGLLGGLLICCCLIHSPSAAATTAGGGDCSRLVDAAAADDNTTPPLSRRGRDSDELAAAEEACVAEVGRPLQEADEARVAAVYKALFWYVNYGLGRAEGALQAEQLAALAGPALRLQQQNSKEAGPPLLPFYRGLLRGRAAGGLLEHEWASGLAVSHSEILAARTPGAAPFMLNAAKLALTMQWTDAVVSFAKKAIKAPCVGLLPATLCAEKPMGLELAAAGLTRAGKHGEAAGVLGELLRTEPLDYGRAHDLWRAERWLGRGRPSAAVEKAAAAYERFAAEAVNEYYGFDPAAAGGGWSPRVYQGFPASDVLAGLVARREPAVFDLQGDWGRIGWGGVARWQEPDYLARLAGDVPVRVLGMRRAPPEAPRLLAEQFGPCGMCDRSRMPFGDFVRQIYHANSTMLGRDRYDRYLTLQGGDGFTGPLAQLAADIPVPPPLQHLLAAGGGGKLEDVNLWMGQTREDGGSDFVTHQHRDSNDNIYAVLAGKKHFKLIAPTVAHLLHTVSPTIHVSPSGHSTQMDPPDRGYTPPVSIEHFSMLGTAFDFVSAAAAAAAARAEGSSGEEAEAQNNDGRASQQQRIDAATVDVRLEPGQLLYLPAGWFHEVHTSGGRHMSVNFWWRFWDQRHTAATAANTKGEL